MDLYANRQDAGRQLGEVLRRHALDRPLVLALPRGGVPVGYEVARALHAPLDVWVARKIGVPWQPELGLGAVAEGGYTHINDDILARAALSRRELAEIVRHQEREVEERTTLFRRGRARPEVRDSTVIVVDDGVATGGTALAAIRSIRAQAPKSIILAIPIASAQTVRTFKDAVDELICLREVDELWSIGMWYEDFGQVSDGEVARLLDAARREKLEPDHIPS